MATQIQNTPGADGDHATFCRLCEAYCGMIATVEGGVVTKMKPDFDNPQSRGHICIKGPAIVDIAYDPDRLLLPLRRCGGPGEFEPVSWDEALADIAARLDRILSEHGGEAFGGYLGNPPAFSASTFISFPAFVAALGSKKLFSAGSQDSTSRYLANYFSYGTPTTTAIPDLPECNLLLIIGANPLVSHGSLLTAPRIREDLDDIAKRGRVIVIDPRRTETAHRYDHIAIAPDTDVWLLLAMLRIVIDEGLEDRSAIEANTVGWDRLVEMAGRVDSDEASRRTMIPVDVIRTLARDFAATERAAIYSRVGVCRGRFSTLTNFLIDALNQCCGKWGKAGGVHFGASPLTTEFEVGGYGDAFSRIGHLPTVAGLMATATMAEDITEPGDGRLRALFVVGGNPVLSSGGGPKLAAALNQLELMVSFDIYRNETSEHAHYILPAPTFLERDDVPLLGWSHMVRPYAQYVLPTIDPMGEVREEHSVFQDIADRMHRPGPFSTAKEFGDNAPGGPRAIDVLDIAFRAGPCGDSNGRDGWSFERLARERPHGLMLDADAGEAVRPPVTYPDRKIRLWDERLVPELDRLLSDPPHPANALRLFGHRHLKSMNSWTHNAERLVRSQKPSLMIHPGDAEERNIADGDMVVIASQHGSLHVTASLTDDVCPGSVCYPHGWGNKAGWTTANVYSSNAVNINELLGIGPDSTEKISGTTTMDGIAVVVAKA